ncbi:hypothetical protein [Vibrio phage vB_VibM_83AMN]|nr:hypothetical protein [Vibrio phage vB_VibM_83AMN]
MLATSNLQQLAQRLANLTARLPENMNELKREVAMQVQRDLIHVTPVKSGMARTNWRISTTPVGAVIPAPASPQAGVVDAIAQGQLAVRNSRPNTDIYVFNYAPYIGKLNRGWSVQAPANFVRQALEATVRSIQNRTTRIVELR